jgi:hypothetical protein
MNQTKRNRDPLGRSIASRLHIVFALGVTLAILGSAWPSQAGSVRASLDRASGRVGCRVRRGGRRGRGWGEGEHGEC